MKKVIFVILFSIMSLGVFGQNADSLWRDAVNGYTGDFTGIELPGMGYHILKILGQCEIHQQKSRCSN